MKRYTRLPWGEIPRGTRDGQRVPCTGKRAWSLTPSVCGGCRAHHREAPRVLRSGPGRSETKNLFNKKDNNNKWRLKIWNLFVWAAWHFWNQVLLFINILEIWNWVPLSKLEIRQFDCLVQPHFSLPTLVISFNRRNESNVKQFGWILTCWQMLAYLARLLATSIIAVWLGVWDEILTTQRHLAKRHPSL